MAQKRTDLAQEAHELWKEGVGKTTRLSGVRAEDRELEGFAVHRVSILDEEGAAALGKPIGQYVTVELDGLLRREEDAFSRAIHALAHLLESMVPAEGTALVAGLGNRAITPDLVGPLAAERTLVTRHLVEQLPVQFGQMRPVCAIAAGVLGTTGVESGELADSLCKRLQPDLVIAVDALASRSLSRVCTTIQIADTGITPGSGVGNARKALNRETLGVPVIALGVPTVVDGATLAQELGAHAGRDLAGVLVTPKDIDALMTELSKIIGYGINACLQEGLSVADMDYFLG